jgi:hypothetical protein
MKLKAYTVLLFLIVSGNKIWAQGCSQCKLVSEQATELDESSFGTNINSGILYLMIIPYLLIFFLFRKRIIGFLKSFISNK